MNQRPFQLVTLLMFVLLAGCGGIPKRVDPYKGLLPKGQQVMESRAPLDVALMKHQRAALVTSANFENYTKWWVDYYERGGAERQQQSLQMFAQVMSQVQGNNAPLQGMQIGQNAARGAQAAQRQAMDPRNVSDMVTAMLTPYFAELRVAPDLASAVASGADYIVVLDYYANFGGFNMHEVVIDSGLYLHDTTLARLVTIEYDDALDRDGYTAMGMLAFNPAAVNKGVVTTFERAIANTADTFFKQWTAQVGRPAN